MRLINEKHLLPPAMLFKYITVPFCDSVQGNPFVLLQRDRFDYCKDVIAAHEAPGLSPPMKAGPALSAGSAGSCLGRPNGGGLLCCSRAQLQVLQRGERRVWRSVTAAWVRAGCFSACVTSEGLSCHPSLAAPCRRHALLVQSLVRENNVGNAD